MPLNQDLLLPILLVGLLVMMFLSTRKRKKQGEELQNKMQVGAKVMLHSGIFGTITSIDGDKVTIETAPKTKMTVIKGAIRVIETPEATPADSVSE
jgi:preprotein translocase subunit YajC